MSSTAAASVPDATPPRDVELNPRAIRDALIPEEVPEFDRRYREAMLAATESLDLTEVVALLAHWRRHARLSRDPEAYRRMLAQIEILNSGGEIETEPWAVTKARLGL